MVKNTAGQKIGAQLVSASDGSAFTGSVTVSVTGDAGTQATGSVGSGACTHEGNGYHTYAPAQAETNYTLIAFTFTGTGAVPVTVQIFTTGYDPTAAQLPANVTQFGGSNGTFSSGRPEVNTSHIAGSAVSTSSAQIGVNVVNAAGTAWNSGAIGASTLASDTITAAKIAADAITDAKVASDVTIASVTGAVGSVAGAVGSVTGNVGGNVAGSVGSVVGAVGSVTGNVGGNVTGTVGGFTTAAKAEIQTEAEDALVTHRLDELLNADSDIDGAAPPTVGSVFHELMTKTTGSFTYDQTTDALEALRDRGDAAWADSGTPPTAAAIADAVWEEAIADHSGTAGSTAESLNAAGSAGDPWTTSLPGSYTGSQAGKMLSDVLTDTAEIGAAGAGLTNINLPNQTMDIVGNITGNLSGSVGSVTGAVGSVTGNVGGNVTGTIGGLTTAAKAEVQTEAEDALAVVGVTTTVTGRIDAAISTRATPAQVATELNTYDGPTNAELATALASADDAVLAAIAALNNLSAAQVNAEVVDALATDTYAEPSAVPAATASLKDKISFLATLARNKVEQTATTQTLRADNGTTAIASATVSDDGTTFVRSEFV